MNKEVVVLEGAKMRFKNFIIKANDRDLSIQDMMLIANSAIVNITHGKEIYLIEKKLIDERFLWLYCQFDNEKLYGDTVLDKSDETVFKNTRDKNHIELRNQLFVLYDSKTGMLYMNNFNKKTFLKEYLKDILTDKEIVIRNIVASLEDFESRVKEIKRIKLVRKKDLFSLMEPDGIFSQRGNVYGLDIPERYTLHLDYENKPIGAIKKALQELKRKKHLGYFEEVLLIGINEAGIEENFNFSTLMKNIEIHPYKNDNDRYDPFEVENLIIREVKKENV